MIEWKIYRPYQSSLIYTAQQIEKGAEQRAGNLKLKETANGNREVCNYVGKKFPSVRWLILSPQPLQWKLTTSWFLHCEANDILGKYVKNMDAWLLKIIWIHSWPFRFHVHVCEVLQEALSIRSVWHLKENSGYQSFWRKWMNMNTTC